MGKTAAFRYVKGCYVGNRRKCLYVAIRQNCDQYMAASGRLPHNLTENYLTELSKGGMATWQVMSSSPVSRHDVYESLEQEHQAGFLDQVGRQLLDSMVLSTGQCREHLSKLYFNKQAITYCEGLPIISNFSKHKQQKKDSKYLALGDRCLKNFLKRGYRVETRIINKQKKLFFSPACAHKKETKRTLTAEHQMQFMLLTLMVLHPFQSIHETKKIIKNVHSPTKEVFNG